MRKILALALATISISSFAQLESNTSVTFSPPTQPETDFSTTRTDNASGTVGQDIKIKTLHTFTVTNNTTLLQNYTVAETCKVDGKEYKKGWGFSLPSKASKSFSENAYLDYVATHAGSFPIQSMTCVANSSACSFDHATLTVN